MLLRSAQRLLYGDTDVPEVAQIRGSDAPHCPISHEHWFWLITRKSVIELRILLRSARNIPQVIPTFLHSTIVRQHCIFTLKQFALNAVRAANGICPITIRTTTISFTFLDWNGFIFCKHAWVGHVNQSMILVNLTYVLDFYNWNYLKGTSFGISSHFHSDGDRRLDPQTTGGMRDRRSVFPCRNISFLLVERLRTVESI